MPAVRPVAGCCLGFITLAVLTATPSLHSDADAGRFEPAVSRYLERDTAPLTSYRAFRRLEAEGLGDRGWMEVWTALDDRTFEYDIVAGGGSERIQKKVLRKVLESEKHAWLSGEARRSGITVDNYEFRSSPDQPEDLLKVLLKPKRKGKLLVNGAMFLEREGADLVRVEGRLNASPSFWIKHVDITRRYERINGFNVPVSVDSVADIRFAGNGRLRMTYRYTHINGRQLLGPVTAIAAVGGSR